MIEQHLKESIAAIRQYTNLTPKFGLILGSGLGDFADTLDERVAVSTKDIPHFPHSTVSGHKGFLVFGKVENVPVVAVQGRTHFYEGHGIDKVSYVVRVMAEMGVQILMVTNAAGGTNPLYKPGDLMIINDQINWLFANPLFGRVVDGEQRWPDMNHAYDPELISVIEEVGLDMNIPLRKGTLMVSSGPTYETAAEVRMIQKLGGDAASMSTVPEVIVARARGIRVAGISCITNPGTGLSSEPLSHEEVTEIAGQVKSKFQRLVKEAIVRMDARN